MRHGACLAVAAAVTLFASLPAMAKDPVPRLTGEITYAEFPKVVAYLKKAKKPVAFDVTLPIDNEESDGHLTTFVLDGQFEVAYLAGKKSSKLYAQTGFDLIDDSYYTLKGVYTFSSSGKDDDGVPLMSLDEVTDAGDAFKDIPVKTLGTVK